MRSCLIYLSSRRRRRLFRLMEDANNTSLTHFQAHKKRFLPSILIPLRLLPTPCDKEDGRMFSFHYILTTLNLKHRGNFCSGSGSVHVHIVKFKRSDTKLFFSFFDILKSCKNVLANFSLFFSRKTF